MNIPDFDLDNQEVEDFETKIDEVYELLEELQSKDEAVVREAEIKVDAFLAKTKAEKNPVVYENKTVINRSPEETAVKKADDLKVLGNDAFRSGDYPKAIELYTSSIMQRDDNHVLFTNRAQARMKIQKYHDASMDCKQAIKLKPTSIKAHVWLSRAFKELGEFQEAIDVLERAEEMAENEQQSRMIKKDKLEIIERQKSSFVENKST